MYDNDDLTHKVDNHEERLVKLERITDVLVNKIDVTNKILFSILTAIVLGYVNKIFEII